MFSPEPSVANPPSASLRNPRRRRRNESDTGTQRHPRKRSRIAQDQFQPIVNGNGAQNGVVTNGHTPALKDLSLREKRLPSDRFRPAKSDASTILTRNLYYTVQLLPALPEKLRSNTRAPFRAYFRSTNSSHYAVATTQDNVVIWDYTFSGASPTARALNLPYPVKTAESLPIASLLTNTASTDVGLVLVYPHSGKITFWENVDSAESLKLFDQRRQGTEGTIKLLGGEVIENVVDAEHAGFILLTSAGRLAQLTIRDAQGRPHINSTFLTSNASKGSFFGELVQMFHTSWRNRPTAVKTRPSTKGRMEIIALTNEGVFKVWDASWAGQNSLVGDIDASVEVRDALLRVGILDQEQKKAVKFLDFALLNYPPHEAATDGSTSIHALLLVATDDDFTSKLQLVQVTLASGIVSAKSVLPLTVYQPEVSLSPRPQLILTGLDRMAFIIHEETVVVVSLSGLSENSTAVSTTPMSAYQDVFHFQAQKGGKIVGSSAEPMFYSSRNDTSNVLLFTKSAGVVRISVNNQPVGSTNSNLPTAKSKIEQWVYYGAAPENILDFTNTTGLSFSTKDIEAAALQISQDILRTDTDYLPAVAHSMDQHLTLRTKALQDLAVFLKNHCSPLSRTAKWTLLWDAEKMAAARAIWREHEVRLQQKASNELTLLEQVIDLALDRYKDDGNSQVGEIDDVRLWFTKEIHRIEKLFPLACKILRESWKNGENQTVIMSRWMKEISDMVLSGIGTPFDIRQQKMDDYCLADEKIEGGVLLSGFEGLPEIWTSKANTSNAINATVNQSYQFVSSLLKKDPDQSSTALIGWARQIACQADAVIKLGCKSHVERYRWLIAQEDEAVHAQGLNLQHQFETKIRREQIVALYDMGESLRGLILAEDLGDFSALVELSLRELDFQKARLPKTNSSAAKRQNASSTDELRYIETQIAHYFEKFGQDFAAQFHKGQISSHRLADLMDKDLGPKGERTKFLRSNPSCAKLSWINEALNEDDMAETGKSLMVAARDQEPNVWCKKLELSLAKLALKTIASNAEPSSDIPNGTMAINQEEEANKVMLQSDRELSILAIQQQLYNHIRPTILEALDQDAAPQEVMRKFGSTITESRSSLAELLRNGFSDLMSHRCMKPETLIDVLTLMDQIPGEPSPITLAGTNDLEAGSSDFYGKEFYLALKVLEAADLEDNQVDMLRRLIWKRCFLRDDWPALNTTNEKSDKDMAEGLMQTVAFETVKEGVRRDMFNPPLNISIPLPSQVVGAGSIPEDFEARFPADLCGPLALDNAADDETLKGFIEHANLDELFKLLQDHAQTAAQAESKSVMDRSQRYRAFVQQTEYACGDEESEMDVFIKEEDGDEIFDGGVVDVDGEHGDAMQIDG